jgi:hypothetical protein
MPQLSCTHFHILKYIIHCSILLKYCSTVWQTNEQTNTAFKSVFGLVLSEISMSLQAESIINPCILKFSKWNNDDSEKIFHSLLE